MYVAQDINSGKDYALKVRESVITTVLKIWKIFQILLLLLGKYNYILQVKFYH